MGDINGLKGTAHSRLIIGHEIDVARPIRVVCIGAGIGGILTGIRMPQQIQNLDLVIYDKNPEVGGTWYENKYPGVRCDIPSHSYQLTFESNTQWSEFYASGAEIQNYMVNLARRYDVHRYCRFRRYFTAATWDEADGKWEVKLQNLESGEMETDRCDILLMATGLLNKWKWPNIPGLETFQGPKTHSANWDSSMDIKGRNVALIGAGSTGIQILPAIQPLAARVDHYMKGKNWISPFGIGGREVIERNAKSGNFEHSPEELDRFRKDPDAYLKYRHKIEGELMQAPLAAYRGTPELTNFHEMCKKHMEESLASKPHIAKSLIPDWSPGCRRLTPGPGYLDACVKDNVDFISTEIKQIHPDAIETVDGTVRKVDAIICATGFDTTYLSGPKITGEDGKELYKLWNPTPQAYMSICPPSMPNMFMYFGPNGGPMTGSAMLMIEWSCDYVVKLIQKIQGEGIKSMVVKPEANNAFSRHIDKFFEQTIFTEPCLAWSKQGLDGRIVGNWPGSGIHARKALLNPRWEDFNYEILPELEGNPLGWLGNGLTVAQVENGFTTGYLDEKQTVDKPRPIRPEISVDSPRGVAWE